jgi:hypothetical protein
MKSTGVCLPIFASVSFICLLMIVPGPLALAGPGMVYGTIGHQAVDPDIWFKTTDNTGLWSCVYTNPDKDTGDWMCGMTIKDIEFRDASDVPITDGYNYYVKEMTIPWIRMTWHEGIQNPVSEIYQFQDYNTSPSEDHVMYDNTWSYNEGNLDDDPNFGTDLTAQYVLDVDNDQQVDFRFDVWYSLDANGQAETGEITMRINMWQHPLNWIVDNQQLDYIEFPFIFNPDIYYGQNDNIYIPNGQNWDQLDDEDGPLPADDGIQSALIRNINDNDGSRAIIMTPSSNQAPTSGDFWALHYQQSGEYSKYPTNYVEPEGINGVDTLVWYIAGYDIANNAPAANTWITVNFAYLVA